MLRILKDQRGFTLIELVIIIILIAVLAGVAIPRFVNLRGEAINAKAKAVQDGMRGAITLHFADEMLNDPDSNGVYDPPASLCAAACNIAAGTGLDNLHALMESAPSYPPNGPYGAPGASGGFYWRLTFDGDNNSPIRLYGVYNDVDVDDL